jgi:hypothetical protein
VLPVLSMGFSGIPSLFAEVLNQDQIVVKIIVSLFLYEFHINISQMDVKKNFS